jgi:hypothetical protein
MFLLQLYLLIYPYEQDAEKDLVVIPEVVIGNPFFLREIGYPPSRA